jgi:hypothetical protein
MAVNTISAGIERRVRAVGSEARRLGFPTLRSLRHGVPAATYSDRARGEAMVSRDTTDRMLFEGWGWA